MDGTHNKEGNELFIGFLEDGGRLPLPPVQNLLLLGIVIHESKLEVTNRN
jgi:hypothetical protein